MKTNFTSLRKLFLHLTLIMILLSVAMGAKAQWAQKKNFGEQTDGGMCFTIGNLIYVASGSDKSFYSYDPSNNAWTALANLPGTESSHSFGVGVALNGKGYLGLGTDASGSVFSDWWEYDPSTNKWTQKASYPVGRDALGYFVINNIAYLCGGTDNAYVYGQCYAYDPVADKWTAKASYPLGAICFPYCFAINGEGYIAAGATSTEVNNTYQYDPGTDKWTAKAAYPKSWQGGVSFVINGIAYCGLGQVGYSMVYKDFYTYDPVADKWSALSPANTSLSARAWSSAAVYNNNAYLGLGWDFGSNFSNDWWQFTPSSSGFNQLTADNVINVINPFSGQLTFSETSFNGTGKATVYNLTGQAVAETTITDAITTMNTSDWAEGVYILQITDGNKNYTRKIEKQ